ncbi:MAG: undecaprenyl-phosphate glucose phosphotransferase [Bacteroidetes bacterium]|nr:undecaprenyl-phosphate glucose phosphotransferase [Bacteroidota bacterium]
MKSLRYSIYIKPFLFLIDLCFINLIYPLSFLFYYGNLDRLFRNEPRTVWLFVNLVWIFFVLNSNPYQFFRFEKIESILNKSVKIFILYIGIVSTLVVLLQYDDISPIRMIYFFLFLFISLFLIRIFSFLTIKRLRKKGFNFRNVIIVGLNKNGYKIGDILKADLGLGYRILSYFDSDSQSNELPKPENFGGGIEKIESFLATNIVHEIFISLDRDNSSIIDHLNQLANQYSCRIRLIPDLTNYSGSSRVQISYYDNLPVISLRHEPLEYVTNKLVKRLFDIIFSLFIILFIFSWLFPILIIAVKLSSKGPAFFKQIRSGENNLHFTCYKFRSMRVHDEIFVQATQNDFRVTKIGAFLRKSNLDELPQFFNVFFGQMSIVGPRPHPIQLDDQFLQLISTYKLRHFTKPGITGWAQVNGFRGETKSLSDMQNRIEHDIWYIENWSFLLDLKILLLTIYNMFKGEKNAY